MSRTTGSHYQLAVVVYLKLVGSSSAVQQDWCPYDKSTVTMPCLQLSEGKIYAAPVWWVNWLLQSVPAAVRRLWANPWLLGTVFDAVSLASVIITRLRVELPYNEIDFAQLFLFKDLLNQPSLGYFCSTNSSSGPVAHKLNHALSESVLYLSAQNDATLKTRGVFLHYEEPKFAGTAHHWLWHA